MQEEQKQPEQLSPEIIDVMRNFVAAIRAVKLYPSNNPVYTQALTKSFESFDRYFHSSPRYSVTIQKTHLEFQRVPVGREAQLNRTIAQDLYAKGLRELIFLEGLEEQELLGFYIILAMPQEELAHHNGIVGALWERGAVHVKVVEAALADVVMAGPGEGAPTGEERAEGTKLPDPSLRDKTVVVAGRSLVVGDLFENPQGCAAALTEAARRTLGPQELMEDRLVMLYRDAGRRLQEQFPGQQEAMLQGLARSILALEPGYREGVIAGRLYAQMDAETVQETKGEVQDQVPQELHEVLTGRFSRTWNEQQVATLLRKNLRQPKPPPASEMMPITPDLAGTARELAEYTPEEMEVLKVMGGVGRESDIIEAAVRTLIFLLPLVKNPYRSAAPEREVSLFSSVVRQLEDMLGYLLSVRDYALASLIVRALHVPVAGEFRSRLGDAVKRASSRDVLQEVIQDMRMNQKQSPQYQAAYSYLAVLDREATPVLLEILAEEKDRSIRRHLMEILRELGKNQIALLGERLSDGRWYFVRNIVNILGESRKDEALAFLEQVSTHKNFHIRQEVLKSLSTIGGKKAATLIARFLQDRDVDIQFMAVRGLGAIQGAGPDEARQLAGLLASRSVTKSHHDLNLEAIRTLGRIGDRDTAAYLGRYRRLRWWRSRRLQEELRAAAGDAAGEIERRQGNAGRTG